MTAPVRTLALLGFLLAPLASALASPRMLEFEHSGGWDAAGPSYAECRLAGMLLRTDEPARLAVGFESARLTIVETWVNTTITKGPVPTRLDLSASQVTRDREWVRGGVLLEWDGGGRGVFLDADGLDAGASGWARWAGNRTAFSPALSHVATEIEYPRWEDDHLVWVRQDLPGVSRRVTTDANVIRLGGEATLAFDHARVAAEDGFQTDLPAFRQVVGHVTTPATTVQTVRFTHAFLQFSGLEAEAPLGSWQAACGEAQSHLEGVATFHEASGRLSLDNGTVEAFEGRELTLDGSFALYETLRSSDGKTNPFSGRPVDGVAPTRAEGAFRAVGVDFETVSGTDAELLGLAARVGFFSALVALLAWAATQLSRGVGFFFSRMTQDRALEHPMRSLIARLASQRPGLILRDLVRITGRPYAVVRHHARVLETVGHVRLLRQGKALHVYPPGESLKRARVRLALETDAAARFLRSRLGAGELSARAVQRELRQHLALSRMGAWKALRRAETRGVVDRIAAPGGDVLRAAPI